GTGCAMRSAVRSSTSRAGRCCTRPGPLDGFGITAGAATRRCRSPRTAPPHPAATLSGSRFPVPGSPFPPSMRLLRPFLATWLTGLLAILPLLLTVGLVAWVVGLLNRFVGPESTLGRSLSVLGMLAGNPALAWLVGTALVLAAIYLLGLLVQSRLQGPVM